MINMNPTTIKEAKRLCKFVRNMCMTFLEDDIIIRYDPDLREYWIEILVRKETRNEWQKTFSTGRQEEMSRWLVDRYKPHS